MTYLIQNESFPWESSCSNKMTLTKEKIIEKSMLGSKVLKYSVNKPVCQNDITYSFGEVGYITIINSYNLHYYLDKEIFNVYLHVDNIDDLFNNLFAIYNNVYGWISIKLNSISTYDKDKLLYQIATISEFYKEVNNQNQHLCINEFEDHRYDIDFIYIKSNFDCIANPYYYNNTIVSNILARPGSENKELLYNKEFSERLDIFNRFKQEDKDSLSLIIRNNGKEKLMRSYEKHILNRDNNGRI